MNLDDKLLVVSNIFISYSSKDLPIVEKMAVYLEQHGSTCFYAARDIPKGEVWAEKYQTPLIIVIPW